MSTATSDFGSASPLTFFSFFKLFGHRRDEPTTDATMLRFLLSTIEVRADLIGARVQNDQDRKEFVDRVKAAQRIGARGGRVSVRKIGFGAGCARFTFPARRPFSENQRMRGGEIGRERIERVGHARRES